MSALDRRDSSPVATAREPIPFSRPVTPHLQQTQCAFLGLGEMGKRMATNLARYLVENGHPPLIVWNRSSDSVSAFEEWASHREIVEGKDYIVAENLEDILQKANLIFTSLSDDAAVKEVYDHLFSGQEKFLASGGGPGTNQIFVDTSTTYPSTAGELERKAISKQGRVFLACPVFGVPHAAEKGDLILAISGDYFAKKIAAHIMCPAIGKKVMDLGSNVERAASFKLVGNAMELGFIELLAECFTLADQAGVGPDKLVELIREQHSSPALLRYSERISKNKYDATGGFTLAGGMADARNIRKLADSHNVPMPTIDVAHQHMISARALGGDTMDWTALVGGERIASGLAPFTGRKQLKPFETILEPYNPDSMEK